MRRPLVSYASRLNAWQRGTTQGFLHGGPLHQLSAMGLNDAGVAPQDFVAHMLLVSHQDS